VQIASRVIARDLNVLIDKAVSPKKADYAVVTGVQIHSWPNPDSNEPVLEYVEPKTGYVVVDGVKSELDLAAMPPLTPRQIAILAASGAGGRDVQVPPDAATAAYLKSTTVMGVKLEDPAAMAPLPSAGGGARGKPEHEVPAWAGKYVRDCC
jgi:Limiting CO2-inducible proteins B/C beta carbonyic anhydrases